MWILSAPVIPSLSLGLSLSSPYLPPDRLDSFMRRMLISRISRRVLAEHHIALSDIHAGRHRESSGEPHVGIIFTGLNVRQSIERCTRLLRQRPVDVEDHYGDGVQGKRWPEVIIDGHLQTEFAYIREHLECVFILGLPTIAHLISFWQIHSFRIVEEREQSCAFVLSSITH
jgi:pyruvate dehydrogenase kinase 2/3/4